MLIRHTRPPIFTHSKQFWARFFGLQKDYEKSLIFDEVIGRVRKKKTAERNKNYVYTPRRTLCKRARRTKRSFFSCASLVLCCMLASTVLTARGLVCERFVYIHVLNRSYPSLASVGSDQSFSFKISWKFFYCDGLSVYLIYIFIYLFNYFHNTHNLLILSISLNKPGSTPFNSLPLKSLKIANK